MNWKWLLRSCVGALMALTLKVISCSINYWRFVERRRVAWGAEEEPATEAAYHSWVFRLLSLLWNSLCWTCLWNEGLSRLDKGKGGRISFYNFFKVAWSNSVSSMVMWLLLVSLNRFGLLLKKQHLHFCQLSELSCRLGSASGAVFVFNPSVFTIDI